jgi:hypothetical protein
MKRFASLLSVAFLSCLVSIPLFARPISEVELSTLVQQYQAQTPQSAPSAQADVVEATNTLSGIAAGAPALADQMTSAANTLSGIADNAPALADQFTDTTNSLSGIADGAPALADQMTSAANTLSSIAANAPGLADQFTDATNTLSDIAYGAPFLADQFTEATNTLSDIAANAPALADQFTEATNTLSDIAANAPALADQFTEATNTLSGIARGADPLARRYEEVLDRLTALLDRAEKIVSAAEPPPPPPPPPVPPPPPPPIAALEGAFPAAGILDGETALGDAIADAIAYYVQFNPPPPPPAPWKVDFAFINGGIVKAGLEAGPVTEQQVEAIFGGSSIKLIWASVLGSDIIKLFEQIAAARPGTADFVQVSDKVVYTVDGTGKLKELLLDQLPVIENLPYAFVTTEKLYNTYNMNVLETRQISYSASELLIDVLKFFNENKLPLGPYYDPANPRIVK